MISIRNRFTLAICLLCTFGRASDLVWTNTAGGAWNIAVNWSPNQIPAAGDNAWITNAGIYSVTSSVSPTLNSLTLGAGAAGGAQTLQLTGGTLTVTNLAGASNAIINITAATLLSAGPFADAGTVIQSGGTLRLLVPGALDSYSLNGGELRGATLTVTNLNWSNGNMNAEANGDRTIIPAGGVLNFPGAVTRNLSYYAPATRGRDLDNYGTWNWTGTNASLVSYGAGVVNNYSNVNVTGAGVAGTYAQFVNGNGTLPIWNNFGTIAKTAGAGALYITSSYLNNSGVFDIQSGQLIFYGAIATNLPTGTIALGATSQLLNQQGSSVSFNANSIITGSALNAIQVDQATVYVKSTNTFVPSLLLNAPGSLQQNTNNVIPTINQTGGTWRMNVPSTVSTYNLSGGELRGATLTVTNLNWTGGDMNADANGDRTIIPPGGVLNFPGGVTRNLSYYPPATRGRDFDNYGTWNWTGTNASLVSYGAGVVNNYSNVNVTGAGVAGTYAQFVNGNGTVPTWNNFGTIAKTAGAGALYITSSYLNNSGVFDIQSGQLIFYGAIATNLPTGIIALGATSQLLNQQSSIVSLNPGSTITGSFPNAIEVDAATVYVNTLNLLVPSLYINNAGASVQQNTNNVIPTINQTAGTWRLNTATTVATYNLTNGELRGANVTVTNLNWLGGQMNADGPGSNLVTVISNLNINSTAAKSLSYWTAPGRSIINNGTGIWGGANIVGQGGATIQNNGSITQNGDGGFQFGGTGANTIFQNNGTFTKTAGTNASYFAGTFLTNAGTFNVQAGTVRFGSAFVQTAGSANLKSNFLTDSILRVESGSVTGAGTLSGTLYNNGALNPGASPGLITGTSFTNSAAATLNMELGGTSGGTNYDQIRLTGSAVLNGTLNVSFVNGFTPTLSNSFTLLTFANRSGTFANIVTPPDFEFTPTYTTTNLILTVTGLTNAPLQIVSAPTNVTVWEPDPATFSATVSGNTPLAFQWQFNGTNINGATNTSYSLAATTPANSGLYTLIVTDATNAQTNVSATLTVIPFDGTIWWTNTAGGNWTTANNWAPPRVPGATNTAIISSNGTYTVTISSPVFISNIVVGAVGGTGLKSLVQSANVTLGNHATFETNGVFSLNGTLFTLNSTVEIRGTMNWGAGNIIGVGRTIVTNTGTISFNGYNSGKILSTNILENYGTLTYSGDGGFGPGLLPDFAGGARLTNYPGGIVQIGTGNGFGYSGSQTLRSYLVNYGTISCAGSASVPGGISVDLVNYGTLFASSCYISRGTNYGTLQFSSALAQMSFFGDESTGEYFTFEPGTVLVGARPTIDVAGLVRWNAASTIHDGILNVGGASGGASSPGSQFLVGSAYTNTYQVTVGRGEFKVPTNAIADLRLLSDALVNGFWTYVINNLGTIVADNVSHTSRNFDNRNLLIVRTNLSLSGGSFYGTDRGHVIITNTATAAFSGGTIDNQFMENFGTISVTAATPFSGNCYLENKANAQLSFVAGTLQTGPANVANFGSITGYGSLAVNTTNYGTVIADDSLNRTLTLSDYWQQSGTTDIRRGVVGGALRILGGVLTGTNSITGSVFNAGTVSPGRPFGTLAIANYTNTASGLETMPLSNTNASAYPTIRVSGTATLAGTLKVTFTNGFFPVTGNTFTAMTYSARSGTFTQIQTPNYEFEVIYTPTNLLLRASNSLPSINLTVGSGTSTQYVCQPFTFSATSSDLDGTITNTSVFLSGSALAAVNGASANGSVELDFPSTVPIAVLAQDDRGGSTWTTQNISIVTYPLHLLNLGGVRTNGFKICMLGEVGSNYVIFASTNLAARRSNWVNLGPMENTNGIWRFYDTNSANFNRRFYEAKQVP
jgi:hypothetical protein